MANADPLYLDYNAGAPLKAAARDAMTEAMAITGNASSVHRFGRAARRVLDQARAQVASLVGARPDQVVFTSGGSEANALALLGCGRRRLVVSAIEHDSVLAVAARLGDSVLAPVDGEGVIDLAALERLLAERDGGDTLVSVMAANNETGVCQPIAEIVASAHAHGALFHCDAVQAAGKQALDMAILGVDLMTLSGHKLGGPAGIGALIVRDGLQIAPLLCGGGQERRRRGGTENLIGAVGFGAAAAAAHADLADQPRLAALRQRLEAGIRAVAPDARVFGAGAPRLANTSCVAMPGVPSEVQVMGLDLAGIAVSAGAACSSGKVAVSHVLRAMGVGEAQAATAIRISLGSGSVAGDVERLLQAWGELYRRAATRDADASAA